MSRVLLPVLVGIFSFSAWSMSVDPLSQRLNGDKPVSPSAYTTDDEPEEFDPSAPGALEALKAYDADYRTQTGEETFSDFSPFADLLQQVGGCYRASCHIFVNVVKSQQRLNLYVDGNQIASWPTSSGDSGHVTPNFDQHPSGPFYQGEHTSSTHPGGDYHGLGNMPYASFYNSAVGYAIHGTPSIGRLGTPASHGCVRIHPDYARYLSQLIRATSKSNVWFTISERPVNPTVGLSMAEPSR